MSHNDFCHVEMTTDDPRKAQTFYGGLFGWQFEDMSPGEGAPPYTMINPGFGPSGGIMAKPAPELPTVWMPYVQVDSLEPSLAKTGSLGGEVMVPATAYPGGRFAVIKDPTGGVIGLLEKRG